MNFREELHDFFGGLNYGPFYSTAKEAGIGHYALTDNRYDGDFIGRMKAAFTSPFAYAARDALGLNAGGSDGNQSEDLMNQVADIYAKESEDQRQHDIAMFNLNQKSAEQGMQFEREMADLAWQREMDASNTAWQRQVADMKKAGINPVAYFGAHSGSGASTPTASVASGRQASVQASKLPTGQVADLLKQSIANSALMMNQGMESLTALATVALGLKAKDAAKLASAFSGKLQSQSTTRSKSGTTTTYTYYN